MSNGRLVQKKINPIQVKVPHATVEENLIFSVEVSEEAIAREAVELLGIDDYFADTEPDQTVIGISTKLLNVEMLPMPGGYTREPDYRAETYLPLLNNPKHARPNRAPKDCFKGLESSLRTLH